MRGAVNASSYGEWVLAACGFRASNTLYRIGRAVSRDGGDMEGRLTRRMLH